jgi:prefoldin subunit 5
MTIDERLERLTERHEALTQSVELLTQNADHLQASITSLFEYARETDKQIAQLAQFIRVLGGSIAVHEQRLRELDDITRKLDETVRKLEGSG